MNRQTTVSVGLLVTGAVLLLSSVTANPSEQPESNVSPSSPSSQSPTETEVSPEQRFIELSRTKTLSHRRRPPSRRFRTSKTPTPENQTTSVSPAEASPQTQSPTTEPVPEVISSSQPPVTTSESIPTALSDERPDVTNKRVRFTKTRAAKSNRGQVFTFTFKNHEHISAKEKQHTQSKTPARYSSAFTTQTPRRRGSVPEAISETNTPDNVAINSGPPGDVPRLRQSGRALNLSDTAGQRNHISQSQNLEVKTAPESIGESTTPNNILPSFRPKLKTRPDNRQVNLLPNVEGTTGTTTQPLRETNPLNEGEYLPRDGSSLASRPQRPLKEGSQREFPNDSGILDELPTPPPRETENPSLQARNLNEEQSTPDFAPPPRVRYVKAGSLRFLPSSPPTPEDVPAELARNFERPAIQTINEGHSLSELDNYPQPRRPNTQYQPLRPESVRFLQESPASRKNVSPEEIRNYVESTPQTSTLREEQGSSDRDSLQDYQQPRQNMRQESIRFTPNDPQEIPPELARDFANLQTLIGIRDSGQSNSQAQSLNTESQPLNTKSQAHLPENPTFAQELPSELIKNFADTISQRLTVNEERYQLPPSFFKQFDRPTKTNSLQNLPNNSQNLEGLRRQILHDFARPTEQTLRVDSEQDQGRQTQGRLQELPRPNEPLKERLTIFVPIGTQRLPFQLPRDFAVPNRVSLIQRQGQEPIRQEVLRKNRPLAAEAPRFLPNNPRGLSSQPAFDDAQSHSLQESAQSNRPLNEVSPRIFPNHPQSPRPQLIRDSVDPNFQTLIENEEQSFRRQESLRSDQPLKEGIPRLLQHNALRLLPQSINFADQNIQNLLESERQGLTRFTSTLPTRLNRLPLEAERFLSNEQAFVGQHGPHGLDNTDVNYRNTSLNERLVNERLPEHSPDTPIRSQIFNSESEINSLKKLTERPSNFLPNTPETRTRLQANQQGVTANAQPTNSEQNVPMPTEPTLPPSTVQPNPQITIPRPGFSINPLTNGPRLIIEFPSSSSGDQSIRLQLNPNAVPAGPVVSPQPSISRISTNVASTSAAADTSNQPNSPSLPTNSVADSSTVPHLPAQLSSPPVTVPTESSVQIKSDLQTSPSNAGITTNPQVFPQQLPSRPLALPARSDDSTSFQLNQQSPKSIEIPANAQSNIPQSTAHISSTSRTDLPLRDQPKSQLFPVTHSPNTSRLPAIAPSALTQVAPTSLQVNSQTQQSQFPSPISPLSKTLAFPGQLSSPQSPRLLNPSTRLQAIPQNSLSNPTQTLKDPRPVEQLTAVTRDSSIQPQLNSQIRSNVNFSVNSLSDNPVFPSGIQATPSPVGLQPSTILEANSQNLTEAKPPVNSSLKFRGLTSESKPPVTESLPKSNAQVPPVDVRLTINFNSNIPGFLQPTSNSTQIPGSDIGTSNNTQLTTPITPLNQPSIPPNTSNFPIQPQFNQHFQPTTSSIISSSTPTLGFPVDLLSPVDNSPLRSQSDFRTPVNLRPTFNPQFDVRGQSSVTQGSPIRIPFSQFLNANSAGPVNTQFATFGNQLNLRASQSPSLQEQLSRFYQNSQVSSPNIGSFINSQSIIPGRPFEIQNQQTPAQDVLTRYQSQSQFQTTIAGDVNSQFNNFGTLPSQSPQPPLTQAPPTILRPVPQVFTANTGIAVNSLSYSPGLSVELLPPPLTGDSSANSKRSEMSTTNEQPRVSFLVNSPELSAELQPPVVSQSSISAQPLTSQPVQPTSPRPSVTPASSVRFDVSPKLVPANNGRVPQPPIELLPPLDPFFPQYSQNPNVGRPPNPIDIPKPPVPALVPPPREKIATPIDIPRPAVPALVPPPRERVQTPIDIPKPDVPALVPPPREHIETPIEIPRPDVPALVPPPRPSDLARFLPPAPTSFNFNPPDVSQQQNVPNPDIPFTPSIQANPQPQHIGQTSTDNPVLILPKSSSRQQGRLNNPLSIEDLSKRVGFLPQSQPAPFSFLTQFPAAQTKPESVFQITDIRAGQLQPIAQEVITSNTPSQLTAKSNPASSQTALFRTPISVGLQAPLLSTSGSSTQQLAFGSVLNNEQTKTVGQTSIDQRLGSTIQAPTQTLLPPVGQEFTLSTTGTPSALPSQSLFSQTSITFGKTSSPTSSTEPPTVNIVPPKRKDDTPLGQAAPTPQPPQEGFVIFQTPTLTVTSQTNRPDSQINITVVTQGGTGHIKPNTTLTAEPMRPANITLSPDSHLFVSTPPASSTSTPPGLTSTLLPPLNERSLSPLINNVPSLNSGSVRNNFTINPFVPSLSQPLLSQFNPFRFSNATLGTASGTSAACPKLQLQHKGHRAPQISGHLILSPGFYPIDDPNPSRCDNKVGIDGKKFNWWQILLNNGGEPSTLSRSNESEDAKIPPLKDPCVRPFETEGVPVFYNTMKTDSRTYYREEIAYHRFPESKNTFLESRGLFVWTQAKSPLDSTAYLVLYTRDDSGFWLEVKHVNCQFNKNVKPNLRCQTVPECFCNRGQKRCTEPVLVLTRNFPVKTFRF